MSDTSFERRVLEVLKPVRKTLAGSLGYFFVPCPLCGLEFAGYEWLAGASIYPDGVGSGQGICPPCFHEGKAQEPFWAEGIRMVPDE